MKNRGPIQIFRNEEKRVNGKPVDSPVILRECVAEILSLYGKNLYDAINSNIKNTIVFKVRYCKIMDTLQEKSDVRVKYSNKIYDIYHLDFSKYPKQFTLIQCELNE